MKCFSASLSLVVPLALTSLSVTTAEVLSEEPILKWYKDAHLAKGKSVFLEQMKKFVEWLKNAEEGKPNLMESNHNCLLCWKAEACKPFFSDFSFRI